MPSGLSHLLRKRQRPANDPGTDHLAVGAWGESVAADSLRAKGYRILGKRVRIGRHDEIDLVAITNHILVFVEVKTRANEKFGRPAASIGPRKKRALARAARRYLLRLRNRPDYYRFDVIEIIGSPGKSTPPITRHIEAAITISRAPPALSD